jgi:hypothetical protein
LKVRYRKEAELSPKESIDVLVRSTLAERRPIHDANVMRRMVKNADLIITGRVDGLVVGVSPAITDYAYCTYLSELAAPHWSGAR